MNEEAIFDAVHMTVFRKSTGGFASAADERHNKRMFAYNLAVIKKFLDNVDDNLSVLELREALAVDPDEDYAD